MSKEKSQHLDYCTPLKAIMSWLHTKKKLPALAAYCQLSFSTVNKWRVIEDNDYALYRLVTISKLKNVHDAHIQVVVNKAREVIREMTKSWDGEEHPSDSGEMNA